MDSRYYASSRKPATPPPAPRRRSRRWLLLPLILLVAATIAGIAIHGKGSGVEASQTRAPAKAAATVAPASTAVAVNTHCASNSSGQLVLVSISQRHLWACNGTQPLYDSAVVTGMENLPADLTPVGTYHIYGKFVNLHLKGSDSTGKWDDYVNYWMPWLHNQYGSYGFHDATWRDPTAFGNISPYSSDASHGCVELPLATAKWLYKWAVIGTTVTIES